MTEKRTTDEFPIVWADRQRSEEEIERQREMKAREAEALERHRQHCVSMCCAGDGEEWTW